MDDALRADIASIEARELIEAAEPEHGDRFRDGNRRKAIVPLRTPNTIVPIRHWLR